MLPVIKPKHNRALIVTIKTDGGWTEFVSEYIRYLIKKSMFESDTIEIWDIARANSLYGLMPKLNQMYDFVFTINRMPSNKYDISAKGRKVDYFHRAEIPILSWYVDNIGHHRQRLQKYALENEYPFFADESSLRHAREMNLNVSDKSFLPMWGPDRKYSFYDTQKRDVPIVFSGSIGAVPDLSELNKTTPNMTTAESNIIKEIIEEMIAIDCNEDAFILSVKRSTEVGTPDSAASIFKVADRWLRQYKRKRLLSRIRKIPIHVYGTVHDKDISQQENITACGVKPIHDLTKILRNTNILLGDFANFVNGIEARPAMAFVNGCVLACEPNAFVRHKFHADSYICLNSEDNNYDEIIQNEISNHHRLGEMDARAGVFYASQRDNYSLMERQPYTNGI